MLWFRSDEGRFPGQQGDYHTGSTGIWPREDSLTCVKYHGSAEECGADAGRHALDALQDYIAEATHARRHELPRELVVVGLARRRLTAVGRGEGSHAEAAARCAEASAASVSAVARWALMWAPASAPAAADAPT